MAATFTLNYHGKSKSEDLDMPDIADTLRLIISNTDSVALTFRIRLFPAIRLRGSYNVYEAGKPAPVKFVYRASGSASSNPVVDKNNIIYSPDFVIQPTDTYLIDITARQYLYGYFDIQIPVLNENKPYPQRKSQGSRPLSLTYTQIFNIVEAPFQTEDGFAVTRREKLPSVTELIMPDKLLSSAAIDQNFEKKIAGFFPLSPKPESKAYIQDKINTFLEINSILEANPKIRSEFEKRMKETELPFQQQSQLTKGVTKKKKVPTSVKKTRK